jgi:hypothetical protein
MSPVLEKVNGDDCTDVVLDKLLGRLQSTYRDSNILKPDPLPSFERFVHSKSSWTVSSTYVNHRDKVSLNIMYAGTKARHLDLANADFASILSISSLHAVLKEKGYLCDRDVKSKTIPICVDLFETHIVRGHSVAKYHTEDIFCK